MPWRTFPRPAVIVAESLRRLPDPPFVPAPPIDASPEARGGGDRAVTGAAELRSSPGRTGCAIRSGSRSRGRSLRSGNSGSP